MLCELENLNETPPVDYRGGPATAGSAGMDGFQYASADRRGGPAVHDSAAGRGAYNPHERGASHFF